MIDTKEFMIKAKAAKTFEIHPVWFKHIQELCDSHDKLEQTCKLVLHHLKASHRREDIQKYICERLGESNEC